MLRYVLLARFLGPEQLGIAAAVILTIQFFESASDGGLDRFVIQDKDGGTAQAQKLAQLVSVIRGMAISGSLALIAAPSLHFIGHNELSVAMAGAAITPLIAGFVHLDLKRSQRLQNFRPEAIALSLSELGSLIATATAAYLTEDFTAVLYGLATRAALLVAISHLLAERPYALGRAPSLTGRLKSFAAPLAMSGLLLFVAGQGDRLVIASFLGMHSLGVYTATLLLILYPVSTIMRYSGSIHLARMAQYKDASDALGQCEDKLASQLLLGSFGLSGAFMLAGPIAITILYGPAFAQSWALIGIVAAFQGTRLLRQWPTTVALAIGRSDVVLVSNLVRLIGLPLGILAALQLHHLSSIVACFLVGEIAALAVSVLKLNQIAGRNMGRNFDRIFLHVCAAGCIAAWPGYLTYANTKPSLRGSELASGGLLIACTLATAGAIAWRERKWMANQLMLRRGTSLKSSRQGGTPEVRQDPPGP